MDIPLLCPCENQKIKTVKLLINKNAEIEKRSQNGNTPLLQAFKKKIKNQ